MTNDKAAALLLKEQAIFASNERWRFVWDMNHDGVYTISDTFLIFKWLFFAPGDWVLLMIMREAPDMGVFLEMSPEASLGGFGAGVISVFAWLVVWSWVWSPIGALRGKGGRN